MERPVSGPAKPALSLAPDEPDQVLRLNRFRAEHPGIAIHAGVAYWQAVVTQRAGESVITRYLLKELLDKLDALTGHPGCRKPARRSAAGSGP
jgi:hypothetical protein